ncbi:hypothetical protein JD844_027739 [Phrynosoma platyrhinos]|uniref:C2H2-type domain-containing protein n=1 Tax=Phrynosoma platyrhinos TaxID=52577 RepID=A0ABQ7SGT7_PHRPL|nr:hypothetical protein JD844_027739 [Phrynosoma platyrhinos]
MDAVNQCICWNLGILLYCKSLLTLQNLVFNKLLNVFDQMDNINAGDVQNIPRPNNTFCVCVSGTKQLKHILLKDVDTIFECKLCRSLFRGLPNLITHKNFYCPPSLQIDDNSPNVNDKQSQAVSDLLEAIYPRVDKQDYIIRLEPIETNQNAVFQYVSRADSSVENTEMNDTPSQAFLEMPEAATEPPKAIPLPLESETVDTPSPAANKAIVTSEDSTPSSKPELKCKNNSDSGHQLICCLCKKEFHSRRSIRRHIRKVHKKKVEELKKFIKIKKRPNQTTKRGRNKNILVTLGRSCPVCFKSFATKANVRRHFDEVHRGLRRDSITPDIATKPGQPLSLGKTAKKSLKTRKQKSSSKAEYNLTTCKCLLCKRKYSSQVMLKKHMQIVHKVILSTKNTKREKKTNNVFNAELKVKMESTESAESVPPSIVSPQNHVKVTNHSNERKNTVCTEKRNVPFAERRNAPFAERKNALSAERKGASSSKKKSTAINKKSTPSSERKNAPSTERKNTPSAERKKVSSFERKNESSAERKSASSVERKNASSTESKIAPSPERKNAPSSERKSAPSVHRNNASSSKRKSASPVHRNNALSSKRKSASPVHRNNVSSSKRKSASSAEKKNLLSAEQKSALSVQRKNASSGKRKSIPSSERKNASSTKRKSAPSAERKSSSAERKSAPPAERKSAPLAERKSAPSAERKNASFSERKKASLERKTAPPTKRNKVKQSSENTKPSNQTLVGCPKKPRKPRLSAGFDFRKLYCKLCKRQFTSKQNLTKHIELHTDGNNIYVKFYRCPLCTYETRRKRDVVRHITVVHKKSSCYLGKIAASLERRAVKKPIDCILNKVAKRGPQRDEGKQNGSKQDITSNSPSKKYEGADVGIELKVTKNFPLHSCNKCGKAFAKKTFLEQHKKTHKANASHSPEENNKTKGRRTRSKALV